MIYPDIDPEIWSKRYGIELKKRQCVKCKLYFDSNIPIAVKGYRGFKMAMHGCGKEYIRSVWVAFDEDIKNKWKEMLFGTKTNKPKGE